MDKNSSDDAFFEKCNISVDRRDALRPHLEDLMKIYIDYRGRAEALSGIAGSLSSVLQRLDGVHSVRWRIKKPEHLIEKICRKKKKVSKSMQKFRTLITETSSMI